MKVPQSKRGSQVLPTKCQVWLTKRAPQTRAPKTWFRIPAFLEPHIEPQIRRLYGHRAIGRNLSPKDFGPSDRFPGCLLDVQLSRRFLTFFECLWTHLSSAFTQKTTFGRSISRHVTCFRLRVPRTQTPAFLDSVAFCVILDMRFQSTCGYSCMITNANFLCKHYAIAFAGYFVHISTGAP